MGVRLSDVRMRKKIEMTKAIEKVIKNRAPSAYITNWSRQVETQKHKIHLSLVVILF